MTAEPDDPLRALVTVRDWLRYAVSRFTAAELAYGHGTDAALDEAAFLLLHTLNLPHDSLEPFLDARLLPSERAAIARIIEARVATRKPAPYLTGEAWIRDFCFAVDERVIVPRSYLGEILLDGGLEAWVPDASAVARVLDLCTGCGCLAIIAAHVFPNARIDAVDISEDALEVARRNIADYGLETRIEAIHSDLMLSLGGRTYDLILANPPYVDAAAMAALPPEFRHEPRLALAGGADGLDLVRRILAEAPAHLQAAGHLVVELGRGGPALAAERPDLPLVWLDTEASTGEVFVLPASALTTRGGRKRPKR